MLIQDTNKNNTFENQIQTVSSNKIFVPSVKRLPRDFKPTHLDIFCGRGRESRVHVGTEHFRQIIKNNLQGYKKTQTRYEKTEFIKSIVELLRCKAASKGGAGFIKYDKPSGYWFEIGDQVAREKVGHAFRDLLKQRSRLQDTDPRSFTYIPRDGSKEAETTKALLIKQQSIFLKFLKEEMGNENKMTRRVSDFYENQR
mmetsp:Transcript_18536/g.28611  ORF Transcript_18536/g.28611 Transcript_18536/m.28611 type:complete len:199 (+) Transcript_18536:40-636(+)